MSKTLEARLEAIVRSPTLMRVLETARDLDLPTGLSFPGRSTTGC